MTYRSIYRRHLWLLPAGWATAHQGAGNKCQWYTCCNFFNILRARNPANTLPAPSPDAGYYFATKGVQGIGGDIGASFWHVQRALQLYGMATVPWSDGGDLSSSNKPPQAVIDNAAANKPIVFDTAPYIKSGPSRDSLHETMAMLLAQGKPVPVTMYASRELWMLPTSGNPDDVVYTYNPADFISEHAVLLIGRDMDKELYYFLNSWGPDFGANGVFCMTFAEFLRCVTLHWHFAQCPAQPVPEHDIMANPIPTAVAADTLVKFFTRTGVKAQLTAAYESAPDGNWQAFLNKAAEHQLPAKVAEILANLPENIIEDYVNRGLATYPAELFYV